ncbi:MAG: DUF2911 domain-containing protein [Chitinophagaceae bacterium]|nr:MAG: DUF2911 domain-containing protein [Chitinophagaceae bacterium]
MKTIAALAFILFFSCNSKDEKQDETVKKSPDKKDTVLIKPSANNPYAAPDLSPMDMIYFPVDYPKLKMTKSITVGPAVRVIYSRPQKLGRKIFGGLLKYDQPWRLGANEATEIQFFKPAVIQNKKIDAGKYILYCIPQEKKWTIVFNTNIDTWGLQQDVAKDIYRFDIPVEKTTNPVEYFTMAFEKNNSGADLIMTWDDVVARLPISF